MIANAVEFEAKIDNNWNINIPFEYRDYFSDMAKVILLNEQFNFIAKNKNDNDSDIQKRMEAFNYLDGLLAGVDVDLDKIKEERLSRQ
jgi:hypothetical protein